MAKYRYLTYDLFTGAPLAELPLTGVTRTRSLNGSGVLSASLPAGRERLIRRIDLSASIPERTQLFVERDGVLVWGGIIWQRNRKSGQIAASEHLGFFERVRNRADLVYTGVDQLTIAKNLVTAAQAQSGCNIGVQLGAEVSGVTRDRTYPAIERKPIGELLRNLSDVEGGFDIISTVTKGAGALSPPVVTITFAYPRAGRIAGTTGLVFESGKNMTDYDVLEDGTRSARTIDAIGQGLVGTASDTALVSAGWPATADTVSHANVTVQATLDSYAAAAVKASSPTPTFWEITVNGDDFDVPYGSWIMGDDCRLHIDDDEFFPRQLDGSPAVDQYMRILDESVTVGADGAETITLTLGDVII